LEKSKRKEKMILIEALIAFLTFTFSMYVLVSREFPSLRLELNFKVSTGAGAHRSGRAWRKDGSIRRPPRRVRRRRP
jgi:hypothetical protein